MEGGCFANFQTNPQCLFWWSQLPLLSASLGWWPWGCGLLGSRITNGYDWMCGSEWQVNSQVLVDPDISEIRIPYMSITLWLLESMLVVSHLWFRGCTSSKILKFSPGRTRVFNRNLLTSLRWHSYNRWVFVDPLLKIDNLLRDFQWGRWLKKAIKHTSQLGSDEITWRIYIFHSLLKLKTHPESSWWM